MWSDYLGSLRIKSLQELWKETHLTLIEKCFILINYAVCKPHLLFDAIKYKHLNWFRRQIMNIWT